MTPGSAWALAAGALSPGTGPDLLQHGDEREVSGQIRKWIGIFNPQRININTRLLMRYDPDVAFGLAIRRAPVVNLRWTVESKDPLIKAFVESQLRPLYRQLAKGGSLAIPFGFQVLGKDWVAKPITIEHEDKVDGTVQRKTLPMAWTYKRFKPIDSRTVTLLIDPATDDWGGVRQAGVSQDKDITVGREKAVLWSHADEDNWGKLEGWPLLDQAYEAWWWKAGMNFYANRYYERRADPTPIGTADPRSLRDKSGLELDGFEYMRRIMRDMKNGAFVVVPSARDDKSNPLFDIKYLTDDQRGEMYQGRIDKLGIQILRGLLVTDEAGTSQETGSRARAEQHAETLGTTQETTVDEWLDEVVNPQVVNPLVLYNFGEKALEESDTRITGEGLSGSMRDILKETFIAILNGEQFLADGTTIPLSKRIDGVAIAEKLGFPIVPAKEVEKLMKAAQNGEDPPAPGEEDDDEPEIDEETERAATRALERRGVLTRNNGRG
jgi:hypothetical protein